MPSALRPLVNEVAKANREQDVQAFKVALSRLARAARDTASPAELTAVIQELVPLLHTAVGISTELAVLAGACVEWGGSPAPLTEVLPGRAVTAMLGYALFPDVWRAVSMSGVGDNFQLHTLLADRLSGQGGIPGLAPPRPDWVAEATDAPLVNHSGTDPIVRRFRLYDGTGSYVYPEGRPADIGMTAGTRVLVIHPPNGSYGWAHARTYVHMKSALTLDAALAPEEAAGWLGRIAPANETDMMAARQDGR